MFILTANALILKVHIDRYPDSMCTKFEKLNLSRNYFVNPLNLAHIPKLMLSQCSLNSNEDFHGNFSK